MIMVLMVLVLVLDRTIAFAFQLAFSPQLLASFVWIMVILLLRGDLVRGSIGRRTVSVVFTQGREDG